MHRRGIEPLHAADSHIQPPTHLNRSMNQHFHILRHRNISLYVYRFPFPVALTYQLVGRDVRFSNTPCPARVRAYVGAYDRGGAIGGEGEGDGAAEAGRGAGYNGHARGEAGGEEGRGHGGGQGEKHARYDQYELKGSLREVKEHYAID